MISLWAGENGFLAMVKLCERYFKSLKICRPGFTGGKKQQLFFPLVATAEMKVNVNQVNSLLFSIISPIID